MPDNHCEKRAVVSSFAAKLTVQLKMVDAACTQVYHKMAEEYNKSTDSPPMCKSLYSNDKLNQSDTHTRTDKPF